MKRLILAATLLLAPWTGAFAQPDSISIEVLASFDYPGEGNSTSAQGINDQGDITGSYDDAIGVTRTFVRYHDGSFSDPIVEPNDTDGFTSARDLNNTGTLGGSYGTADGETHGFLLSGANFTEFDVPNSVSTYIYGLKDANDFVGVSYTSDSPYGLAYVSIGGSLQSVDIPSVKISYAYGINNAHEVVGYYYKAGTPRARGFFRAADGTITAPIDPRGSTFTFLSGINEKGIIVGRYADTAGTQHGLVLKMPRSFLTFDYPGATFTSVSGINNQGLVTGRYETGDGIFHGYLGRVKIGR